jgi:polyferredoxin
MQIWPSREAEWPVFGPVILSNSNGGKRATGKLRRETGRKATMLLLLLLVVLLLAFAPAWPYSRGWGYYPSGALGAVLLIVIALVLFGQLRL